ncbi:hypothetical protein DOTSEDRAFT_85334 [Dothistroma septosporum NZE10]|uniref:O-methyltransferase C-terminal domain-containing protein n=1 Tax=Dothistroma septosporum (strain NZE10 / CBS 128990) TaxID=675120 RepID=N1Q333_DOTSN|nr:hypothetical protein DOTSEDRAFT_85334 [Dothistroma septosporum NZE10]
MAGQFEAMAQEVAREAKVLCDFFNESGYYQPAFNQGGFIEFDDLPKEVEASRKKLQAAATAVHDLASGPKAYVKSPSHNYHDTSTLGWLLNFKIPEAVPLHGSVSYARLATTCNVNESHLRSILRHSMTNHLFREPTLLILATDQHLRATLQHTTVELFPTSAKLIQAHETWMHKIEQNRAAFQVAWNTDLPIEEYLEQEGLEDRLTSYSNTHALLEGFSGYDMDHTIAAYDWSTIRRLVIIGGASSLTAISLARQFPNLRIMVEDQSHIIDKARANLPEDLERKIYFTVHDFTSPKPQPDEISGADVYILRDVLSHYSDEYAAQVLDGLVELLQDGAKLLIIDAVLPSKGLVSLAEERVLRGRDLEAILMENGKQRQLDEWEKLLHEVDSDLMINAVRRSGESAMSVLEVVVDERVG